MIASGTIIIDGQTYRKGDVIHDLGGWDCIDTDGSKRYYWGKSSEVDKLPHYVASGSTALCVDTGENNRRPWPVKKRNWFDKGRYRGNNDKRLC